MQLQVLEVAIGLAATFFVVALIASAVVELIAIALQKRSDYLERAIGEMLSGDDGLFAGFRKTSVYQTAQAASSRKRGIDAGPTSRKPSYLSARAFADGVLEALAVAQKDAQVVFRGTAEIKSAVDALPDGPIKRRMIALFAEANDDLMAVKAGLEGWFDDTMDRLQGAFKRWSQWVLVIVGVVLAVVLNVSAIRIVDSLWNDPTLRAAVADSATELSKDPCPDEKETCPPEEKIQHAIDDLQGLKLPIGWGPGWSQDAGAAPTLLGMLITGLATMLGAPFWFDFLTRLAGIRGSRGVPPRAENDAGSATSTMARATVT